MSETAERAWESWMELHTPIDHTRREAFLAGWAAREPEVAQARSLLAKGLDRFETYTTPDVNTTLKAGTRTFLEATNG